MTAHVDEALRQRGPQLEVMRGRDGIAERSLDPLLGLQSSSDGRLHVAKVVEGVEDSKNVHAAFRRVLDEELDGVIGEVALGDQVLTSDQRLYRCVWSDLGQLAQEFPWIFVSAELRLKGGAAKRLHCGKTDGVHLFGDRDDLIASEVPAEQRLLRVTKRRVDQPDPSFLLGHLRGESRALFGVTTFNVFVAQADDPGRKPRGIL